jgi:hypothetical protein
MKKIALSVIAATMLLSNVAFAATKTSDTNTVQNSTVSSATQNNVYHVDSTDPH